MSANPAGPPRPEGAGYIRGGGGVQIDLRRLLAVALGICLVGLVAATALLAVAATNQNNHRTQLKRHGVPVEATVLGCLGLASGSGATVYSYSCRARYSLEGQTYETVLKGTNSLYPVGQTIAAVAVPGHPNLLTTAAAVATESATWTAYIATIVTGALTMILAVTALMWYRRWR
jgi:hypothetical protein